MLRYKVADVYTKHPTLETERLILRQLTRDDAESLYAIASVPEVSRYLMWDRHTSLKYTKHYLKDILRMYESLEYFEWGVVTKSDVRLIGTCGYTKFDYPINRGEIGYSFAPDVWGKAMQPRRHGQRLPSDLMSCIWRRSARVSRLKMPPAFMFCKSAVCNIPEKSNP